MYKFLLIGAGLLLTQKVFAQETCVRPKVTCKSNYSISILEDVSEFNKIPQCSTLISAKNYPSSVDSTEVSVLVDKNLVVEISGSSYNSYQKSRSTSHIVKFQAQAHSPFHVDSFNFKLNCVVE